MPDPFEPPERTQSPDPVDSAAHAVAMTWSVDTRSALRRLDPTQSRALQLIYFNRRSQQQVAEELRLTDAAVARMVASAMQSLAALVVPA